MFAYQGRQRILLIIGVVFLGVGMIVGTVIGSGALVDLALDVAGEPCRAEVMATELRRNVKINGRHPTEIHFVCTAGGASVESSSSTLSQELLAQAEPGAWVHAEVLPSLSVGRVDGTTYSAMGRAGLFVFIFPLVGLALALHAHRSNRREIRAFVQGMAVRGRVVRREEDRSTRENRRHPWRVVWEFEVDGRRYEGSLSHMDKATLEGAIPTDEIVVLCDPRRPRTNTVYIE